jgi:acetyl esterase
VTLRPEFAKAIEAAAAESPPPLSEQGPDGARATHADTARLVNGPPDPVEAWEDRTIPGPGGEVPVRVYRPATEGPRGLVVFFHGGGWVVGTLQTYDPLARALANASGSVVVSVGYRLAPEHPFPAGVDDCWAATRWAAEHAEELGAEPGRLAVAGDSAGGELAAVVARRARDAGGPDVALQVLLYPALDPTCATTSYRELGDGYLLTAADMRWYWHQYVGCANPANPEIAPAGADLAGLAPALVITAEYDLLRDEGEAYAHALEAAGVPTRLLRWPGVVHSFIRWRAVTPAAAEATERIGDALRGALSPSR